MTDSSAERRLPKRLAWRPRARMVYLLLAVFAFVALAPLGTVAWKLIATNREALKTSQQEYQLLLASTVSRGVDIYVEGLRGQLAGVSRSLGAAFAGTAGESDAASRRILGGVSDERILYLRFTDVRGRVLDVSSALARPAALEPIFLSGFRAAAESLEGRS